MSKLVISKSEIRNLRFNLNGRDYESFAKRFGVSANTVYKWENGTRVPSQSVIIIMKGLKDGKA